MSGAAGVPPPTLPSAPAVPERVRSAWPAGLVVVAALAGVLALAGLVVLLRAPATMAAPPPPPRVAPAPVPEQSDPGPGLPSGVPTSGEMGPVDMLFTVLGTNPETAGVYTREQVAAMARWACRRIARWEPPVGEARLRFWARMQAKYDITDATIPAIFTGVLEPVCSDGRGNAV